MKKQKKETQKLNQTKRINLVLQLFSQLRRKIWLNRNGFALLTLISTGFDDFVQQKKEYFLCDHQKLERKINIVQVNGNKTEQTIEQKSDVLKSAESNSSKSRNWSFDICCQLHAENRQTANGKKKMPSILCNNRKLVKLK